MNNKMPPQTIVDIIIDLLRMDDIALRERCYGMGLRRAKYPTLEELAGYVPAGKLEEEIMKDVCIHK